MNPNPAELPSVPRTNGIALELPADPAYLVLACRVVCGFASLHGIAERDCRRLELAVDEICTNCITHAYERDPSKRYRVTVERDEEDMLVVRIFDRGRGFQIEQVPVPDLCCGLLERQIGGLGLMFAQKATDSFAAYRTHEGENCVEMKKRLPAAPAVPQT